MFVGAVALATLICGPSAAAPRVLFIGNSFTFGATSAVRHYRADAVHDLNGEVTGGVPALFRLMAQEVGLHYDVSLETMPGAALSRHWNEKRHLIDRRWDIVVMQSHSTLDAQTPGDAEELVSSAKTIATALMMHNPHTAFYLTATWPRADLIYEKPSPWYGAPLEKMTSDLRYGYEAARTALGGATVLPVGDAWLRAISDGIADSNPYDGIAFNTVDLWGWDHYHASTYGYYLEALIAFGSITGRNPRDLGPRERCADDLGISPDQAVSLQRVAEETLNGEAAARLASRPAAGYPAVESTRQTPHER